MHRCGYSTRDREGREKEGANERKDEVVNSV
jgi:hypothetical protein